MEHRSGTYQRRSVRKVNPVGIDEFIGIEFDGFNPPLKILLSPSEASALYVMLAGHLGKPAKTSPRCKPLKSAR